jgi:RNA polymerase sigma factor (sigma-70 family)
MVSRTAGAALLGGFRALTHLGVVANLSDAQLVDRFLGRDGGAAEAFEALVVRHGPMVFDLCRNILRDTNDAQDAFQATFLVLACRASSIRRRDSLAGWLLGVARRVALRYRGEQARRRIYEGLAAEMRSQGYGAPPEEWPELHEEIGRLPHRYREPVVLCYLEGLSTDAAAIRLGCPKGTVLSRLSRARERLRGRLIRRGLEPSPALIGARILPQFGTTAIPPGLLTTTVRASLEFAEHSTTAADLFSTSAVFHSGGVIHTMVISRLRSFAALAPVCAGAFTWMQTSARPSDGRHAATEINPVRLARGNVQVPPDEGRLALASPEPREAARNPEPPRTSEFPFAVRYEQGATRFLDGDKITIQEVRGTAETMTPGNLYWIKGTYSLASHDRAMLAAYTTAANPDDGNGSYLKVQRTVVNRGSGTFTLFLPMSYKGWPHVSFYPADGGADFGGNYFGTGDSVLKEWWGSKKGH